MQKDIDIDNGIGYPRKPYIILPKYITAIFINGYFWHGHNGCKYSALPKTKIEFWFKK